MVKRSFIFRGDGLPAGSVRERWSILLGRVPGRVDWKGLLFFVDWRDLMLIVFIILMTTAYKVDVKACHELVENPLTVCKPACEYINSGGFSEQNFSLQELNSLNNFSFVAVNNS